MLNKIDMLPADDLEEHCSSIVQALDWEGPVYRITALGGEGTQQLAADAMARLEELDREAKWAREQAEKALGDEPEED